MAAAAVAARRLSQRGGLLLDIEQRAHTLHSRSGQDPDCRKSALARLASSDDRQLLERGTEPLSKQRLSVAKYLYGQSRGDLSDQLLRAHLEDHRMPREVCEAACGMPHTSGRRGLGKCHHRRDAERDTGSERMAMGGRAPHHIKAYGPDRRNTFLFSSFRAAGTRGRSIVEGAGEVKVHGGGFPPTRRCQACRCPRPTPTTRKPRAGYSASSDRRERLHRPRRAPCGGRHADSHSGPRPMGLIHRR